MAKGKRFTLKEETLYKLNQFNRGFQTPDEVINEILDFMIPYLKSLDKKFKEEQEKKLKKEQFNGYEVSEEAKPIIKKEFKKYQKKKSKKPKRQKAEKVKNK